MHAPRCATCSASSLLSTFGCYGGKRFRRKVGVDGERRQPWLVRRRSLNARRRRS
jgi:hypothetical protein